jgi:hypothetical protein
MAQVMREMATALAPGGRAVLLAGGALAGARDAITAVYADKWLPRLARSEGFVLVAAASQPRTMLGSWEKRAFSAAPKREHLMLFVKHG